MFRNLITHRITTLTFFIICCLLLTSIYTQTSKNSINKIWLGVDANLRENVAD